jgi:quercetin dioxygenase-like cupin family protein
MTGNDEVQPVVLSPQHTDLVPAEKFNNPTYGELSWHTLFSQGSTPTKDLTGGVAVCPPNTGHLCVHHHPQAEIYYILEGEGTVMVGGAEHVVTKGSAVYIPGGIEHGVKNESNAEFKWFYVFPTSDFKDITYTFTGGD